MLPSTYSSRLATQLRETVLSCPDGPGTSQTVFAVSRLRRFASHRQATPASSCLRCRASPASNIAPRCARASSSPWSPHESRPRPRSPGSSPGTRGTRTERRWSSSETAEVHGSATRARSLPGVTGRGGGTGRRCSSSWPPPRSFSSASAFPSQLSLASPLLSLSLAQTRACLRAAAVHCCGHSHRLASRHIPEIRLDLLFLLTAPSDAGSPAVTPTPSSSTFGSEIAGDAPTPSGLPRAR